MYCQHCGSEVQEGSKFCSNCGSPVTNAKEEVNRGEYISETVSPSALKEQRQKIAKLSPTPYQKQKEKEGKNFLIFLVVVGIVFIIAVLAIYFNQDDNTSTGFSSGEQTTAAQTTQVQWHQISPKEVFDVGGYIEYEGVKIGYKGNNTFLIDNTTDTIYGIQCSVYGIKKDGTSEWIGTPSFAGVDKAKYEQEKEENGWAIQKLTNKVRPRESLEMTLDIYDLGSDYPDWDIDGDGYYDISFTLRPQENEDTWSFSTNDPQTDYYKLRAE